MSAYISDSTLLVAQQVLELQLEVVKMLGYPGTRIQDALDEIAAGLAGVSIEDVVKARKEAEETRRKEVF